MTRNGISVVIERLCDWGVRVCGVLCIFGFVLVVRDCALPAPAQTWPAPTMSQWLDIAMSPSAAGAAPPAGSGWWSTAFMSNSNAPAPARVFASSEYSAAYRAYRSFTNAYNAADPWVSVDGAFPHWLAYDIGSGSNATARTLIIGNYPGYGPKAFGLLGSNDTGAAVTLFTNLSANTVLGAETLQVFTNPAPAAYRYYFLICTAGWGTRVALHYVAMNTGLPWPQMTGPTNGTYVVTANTNDAGANPWEARDGSFASGSGWQTATLPCWLQFDYGSGASVVVSHYSLWGSATVNYGPKGVSFDASNNGSDWTTIQTNMVAAGGFEQRFTTPNTTGYRYYRLFVTSRQSTATLITECQLWQDVP